MFSSINNKRKQAQDEVEKRRLQSRTYTEALDYKDPNVIAFLNDFYEKQIFERGLEFRAELDKYSDSVGEHYKFLVPEQVSFDDFFSRYIFRCDIERVVKEFEDEGRSGHANTQQNTQRPKPVGRSKSSDSILNVLNCLGDDGSQGGRKATIRSPRNRYTQPSSSAVIAKEKQTDPNSDVVKSRQARNEMALKLLEEAKGRPLDQRFDQ